MNILGQHLIYVSVLDFIHTKKQQQQQLLPLWSTVSLLLTGNTHKTHNTCIVTNMPEPKLATKLPVTYPQTVPASPENFQRYYKLFLCHLHKRDSTGSSLEKCTYWIYPGEFKVACLAYTVWKLQAGKFPQSWQVGIQRPFLVCVGHTEVLTQLCPIWAGEP